MTGEGASVFPWQGLGERAVTVAGAGPKTIVPMVQEPIGAVVGVGASVFSWGWAR